MDAFLKQNILTKIKISEAPHFIDFGKDGRRQMMKIRLIQSWRSWIWDQHLSKHMNWSFCNFLKPRNHKTIQSQNHRITTP